MSVVRPALHCRIATTYGGRSAPCRSGRCRTGPLPDAPHPPVRGSERLFLNGRFNPGWRAVVGSFVGLGTGPSIALVICFGVFAPMLRQEFGWSTGEVSLGATVICLTLAVASPVQGLLVDRFGARRLLLCSLPLFGAGLATMSRLGPEPGGFYLACALLVVVGLGAWPLSFMTIVASWFDRRLGLALGVAQIGAGLGGALLPALLALVFALGSWRTGYLVLGAIQVAVLLPVALWAAHEGGAVAARDRGEAGSADGGLSLREVLRSGSFHVLAFAFLLMGVVSSGVMFHQVSIMLDHGLSQSAAIGTQSALLLGSMVGRFTSGWALDFVRVNRLMPAILLASGAACALYATQQPTWVLVACTAMIGFTIGAEFDVMGFAVRRYHGMRAFGTVFGLIYGTFQIGSAIGAWLMGHLRDSTASYAYGLALLAALCVLAAIVLALLGPYRFATAGPDAESATVGTQP